ncbi:MAG: hypothetical protein R6W78_06340, partial [Bacteroidales bacterium]
EIARQMGVNYLLEGSVRKRGEQVRITVQLIDGKSDRHLWSENYDRQLADIFFIQSDIAQNVARELRAVLSPTEIKKLQTPSTTNPEAYDQYLMGWYYANQRTKESNEKSIEYYKKALEIDNDYALAHAGMADAHAIKYIYGWEKSKEEITLAKTFVNRALEIDPNLPDAHAILGKILLFGERNWEEARRELLVAIKLNPDYAYAHFYLALLSGWTTQNEEAIKLYNLAISLEPYVPFFYGNRAVFYWEQGNLSMAYTDYKKCLDLTNPEPWELSFRNMFVLCLQLGYETEAIDYLKKAIAKNPATKSYFNEIDGIFNRSGLLGLYQWLIELEQKFSLRPPGYFAEYYAFIGDKEKAFYWLEKVVEEDCTFSPNNIFYKELFSDPRFKAIIEKMGMTPYYYKDQE